jgi:hypothetical protein
MEVRRAVDQDEIVPAGDLGEERLERRLDFKGGAVGQGDVPLGCGLRPGEQVDSGDARRAEHVLGEGLVAGVEGRDGCARRDLPGRLGTEEALREARLGVVVHNEDARAAQGERAGQVVRRAGLADAPLLVEQGDDGHARNLRGLMGR